MVLLRAIGKLPRWQRVIVIILIAAIMLTWLATCLVLASYL
jgi:hypothetical protein